MKLVHVKENRDPELATKSDIEHLSNIMPDEVRVIEFNLNRPTITLGKSQNLKVDSDYDIRRKYTQGTAVYAYDSELILTICVGESVFNTNATSLVQNYFISKFNEVLNDLGILSSVTGSGSRHSIRPEQCFNAYTKNEIIINNKKIVGCSFIKDGSRYLGHMILYIDPSYRELDEFIEINNDEVLPISLHELGIDVDKSSIVKQFLEKLNE